LFLVLGRFVKLPICQLIQICVPLANDISGDKKLQKSL
jgi:hypothetical protein